MLSAPGPGSDAPPSNAALPVSGMQKTPARIPAWDAWSVTSPAGEPFSAILLAVGCPNAPALLATWPGQNNPSVAVLIAVPVVSASKVIDSAAWKPASGGRQSRLVITFDVVTHAWPVSSPAPAHVPEMHLGHGHAAFPVM